MVGVVALSREDDVFLGLKIEIHEYNELRLKAGLSEIETPHKHHPYVEEGLREVSQASHWRRRLF